MAPPEILVPTHQENAHEERAFSRGERHRRGQPLRLHDRPQAAFVLQADALAEPEIGARRLERQVHIGLRDFGGRLLHQHAAHLAVIGEN